MFEDINGLIWNFVLHIANMVVLFLILRKLLFKPVTKFMNERKERFESQARELSDKEAELDTKEVEYKEKIESAKEEARNIISKAHEQSKQHLADEHEQAIKKSEDIIKRGRKQVEAERELAMQGLREETAKLAVDISSKILEREVSETDNKEIISAFLERMK